MQTLYLKIDVDTERGTRIGVPNLQQLFAELGIRATFLFSLGPDNTGRALKRIFRPGFLKKVSRTSVISTYGIRTLCNGVLWPGPHIGKRHAALMQAVHRDGHEVGIHCYDHVHWQDNLMKMDKQAVFTEFEKALTTFKTIFGHAATTAGAAGWQANSHSLAAYDAARLKYGSDARGYCAFYPAINGKVYRTLQIPTTLPTLDELLGRPEYPQEHLIEHYLKLINENELNTLTIHVELEGMRYLGWFTKLIQTLLSQEIKIAPLHQLADQLLQDPSAIPVCELQQGSVDGRSGTLAIQAQPQAHQ